MIQKGSGPNCIILGTKKLPCERNLRIYPPETISEVALSVAPWRIPLRTALVRAPLSAVGD